MLRNITIAALFIGMVGTTLAETVRTRFTKENRFPQQYHLEVGGLFDYADFDSDREEWSLAPYARYGVTDRFAVVGAFPFRSVEQDSIDLDESGIGDIQLALEFLAWQDIFKAPWIIPHAQVSFGTGDEDDQLGAGETTFIIGAALGATAHDVLHYVLDARYEFVDQDENDGENIASVALSLVWELDDQFALIGEVKVTDDDSMEDDNPVFFLGGFYYEVNDDLGFGVEVGTVNNSDQEVLATSRVVYTF